MIDSLFISEIITKLDLIYNAQVDKSYSNYINPIITVVGMLFASALTWYFTFRKYKLEIKEKYKTLLIENKFQAMQTAYNFCIELPNYIHEDNKKQNVFLNEFQSWYNRNSLYLNPEIREEIKTVIKKLTNYNRRLQFFFDKNQSDKTKANELLEEIEKDFKDINSIAKKVEQCLDQYYWY